MTDQVFTTRGWLPPERVMLRESVVVDDDDKRVIKIDKYDLEDGEWVGNDLRINIKRTQIKFGAETGSFS